MESSNSCVAPSPKTKISFFWLSIWMEELLSAAHITTFLPKSKTGNEKGEPESNSAPYPE